MRLSLKKGKTGRFQVNSLRSTKKLATPNPPKNTKNSTSWAVRNLNEWYKWHNSQPVAEQCPVDFCRQTVLLKCSTNRIWLQLYVAETRNKTGQPYPPKSLYSLLHSSLYGQLVPETPREWCWRRLSNVPTISVEEENALWSKRVLNVSTPHSLLRAVVFYTYSHTRVVISEF